jgi:outer membrane protein TolC
VRAEADVAVGLGASRDVTDAARAYAELRVAYFDAAYRHNVALAELARATGTLNDPDSSLYPNGDDDDARQP